MFYIVLLTLSLYYMTHIPDKLSQPAAQEDEQVDGTDIDINKKSKEMAVVCESNAIVDPRTMVVHFEHTAVTC